MSNEILPLSDETLQLLKQKSPDLKQPHHEALFRGPLKPIHSIVFEEIGKALAIKAAIKT